MITNKFILKGIIGSLAVMMLASANTAIPTFATENILDEGNVLYENVCEEPLEQTEEEIKANGIILKFADGRYNRGADTRILPGNEVQVKCQVVPDEANQTVTFESLDPDIATVSSEGVIKAIAPGTARIVVKTVDGSNTNRVIYVGVPYVVEMNDASDLHCLKTDEDWMCFDAQMTNHPGIVWRYTPKKTDSKEINIKFKGKMGKSGALFICYGDGTDAANSTIGQKYEDYLIKFFHASVYREEIGGQVISFASKPFAIYYSHGDSYGSDGFNLEYLKEYARVFYITYDNNGYFTESPTYKFEPGEVLTISKPVREGFEFDGWYLNGTKLEVNEDGRSILDTKGIEEDITLKARWKGASDIPGVNLFVTNKDGITTELKPSISSNSIEKGSIITMSNSLYGASIFYTMDGSEPNLDSSVYTGKIKVNSDITLRAVAIATGGRVSEILSWNLKINEPENYLGDVRYKDVLDKFGGDISKIPNGLWVAGYKDAEYTSSSITFPSVRVYDYKTLLSPGLDYKVSYKNNKKSYVLSPSDSGFNSSIAPQIVITGRGNYNLSMTEYFKILPREIEIGSKENNLKKAAVYFIDSDNKTSKFSATYTGDEIKPLVRVEYPVNGAAPVVLNPETDYTVCYSDNVLAGKKANVIIIGKGKYKGFTKKSFSIASYDESVSKEGRIDVKLADAGYNNTYSYVKGGVCPETEVTYSYTDKSGISINQILKKGVDYTVTYKNNNKTGNAYLDDNKINSSAPTAIVKFKGSFKGTISTTFNISPSYFDGVSVIVADKVALGKSNSWKSMVSLVDSNGKKLTPGKDFDNKYITYTYMDETEVSHPDGSKKIRSAEDIVDANDLLPVGTYIRVAVSSGKSDLYSGMITGLYKIIPQNHDLSKATVKIINPETGDSSYMYTGSNVCIDKSNIHVYINNNGKMDELASSCFEIESYTKNINKGKAFLVIKGIGEYGGLKTVPFSIIGKTLQ